MDGANIGMLAGAAVGIGAAFLIPGAGLAVFAQAAAIGASLGGMVGGMVDPPKSNMPNVRGPMEAHLNTNHRNLPVPIVYGIDRVGGNLIWFGGFATRIEQTGGGKGKPVQKKVYYLSRWALSLSEGRVEGIGRVWVNDQEPQYSNTLGKQLSWQATIDQVFVAALDGGSIGLTLNEANVSLQAKVYAGTPTQEVDALLSGAHLEGRQLGGVTSGGLGAFAGTLAAQMSFLEVENPPAFRNLAYLMLDGQVGQIPALPVVSVEVVGIRTAITIQTENPFPIRLWNVYDPARWNLNVDGTIDGPFYGDTPPWIFTMNSAALGAQNRAYHTHRDVFLDMTKDWTLTFYLHSKTNVLQSSHRWGVALVRRSDNALRMRIHVDSHSEATNDRFVSAVIAISSFTGSVQDIHAWEDTTGNTFGATKVHAGWLKVEYRAATGKVTFFQQHKVGTLTPDEDWTTVLEAIVPDQSVDPEATIALWADNNTQGSPLAAIHRVDLVYFSTQPITVSQRGNPAWIIYDFLTNTRYGVGYSADKLDLQSFSQSAAYCDEDLNVVELIPPDDPEGKGITDPDLASEPRFRLDLALTERKPGIDILQDMLSTCRGFLTYSDGVIGMRIERPEDPQGHGFSDNPADNELHHGIIEGSLSFSEISSRERPNRVRVEFIRADDGYKRDFAQANDEWDQDVRGEIVEKTFTLLGIKRTRQALRMAQYFLDQAIHTRWVCSFRVGIGGMDVAVGDIRPITHSRPGWVDVPFRITRIQEEENDELTIEAVQYVRDVYHDQSAESALVPTKMPAAEALDAPPNVIRLRAFEPRGVAFPVLYVTYSKDLSYGSYLNEFVFRRRGALGQFEVQDTASVDSATAYLGHDRVGFDGTVGEGTPIGNEDVTTALIAHWKLEEASGTRNDQTASALHLTDNGGVGQAVGQYGNAASFDGTNDYLSRSDALANALRVSDKDFTICGWFYLADMSVIRGLCAKDNGGSREFGIFVRADGRVDFELYENGGQLAVVRTAFSSVTTNTWYFVRAWHDKTADQIGIQLDKGSKVTAGTGGTAPAPVGGTYSSAFTLGRRELGPLWHQGRLDEWRYYDRLLTDAQKDFLIDFNGVGQPASVHIEGEVVGMSARVFDAAGDQIGQGVESGGAIAIPVTAQPDPFTGSIQLYFDAAFTVPALRGRWPEVGTISIAHEDTYTYKLEEVSYTANPAELLPVSLLGALPANGSMQFEAAQLNYTGFVQDRDGDKIQGVTWPLEPASVTPDNRISDVKVYVRESGVLVDRTSDMANYEVARTVFAADNDEVYIGSATKQATTLLILLKVLGSADAVMQVAYSKGSGVFAVPPVVTDNTTGLTLSGYLTVEPPVDWATNTQDGGSTIGDGVARFYLRLKRTADTLTTPPQVLRLFVVADALLTLQEPTARFEYLYSDDDLGETLTFEVLAENIVGKTADAALAPTVDIDIQRHAVKPAAVTGLQLDGQGNDTAFTGGDAVFDWLYTSAKKGAGNVRAGEDVDGAGGSLVDIGFQRYAVEIWTADGLIVKRTAYVTDSEGQGTYTYTSADRTADGLGNDFLTKVYQEANGVRSDAKTLNTNTGEV